MLPLSAGCLPPAVRKLSGRLEQQEPWSRHVLVGFKLTHFIYRHALRLQREGMEVRRTHRVPRPWSLPRVEKAHSWIVYFRTPRGNGRGGTGLS